MLDKLEAINQRYLEISEQMNDPEIMSDMKRYIKLTMQIIQHCSTV